MVFLGGLCHGKVHKVGLIKSYTLPIVIVSEGNLFEHWTKSNARHKRQKKSIKDNLSELSAYKDKKIVVKLVRIASRKLDTGDNLNYSFKWIRDSIADIIYPGMKAGRADDTDLIEWQYDQEKGKPKEKALRVEIYAD